MIKIKCLSEDKLSEIGEIWKDEPSPILCKRLSDTYSTNYDVQLSDEAILIHSRIETTIYYRGSELKFNELDYVQIEIL